MQNFKQTMTKPSAFRSLPKEASDWITVALDPFHDVDVQLAGLPDSSITKTVVKVVKRQANIVQPVNNTGGIWDAHIFSTPISPQFFGGNSSATTRSVNIDNFGLTVATANVSTTPEFAPIMIATGKPNTDLLFDNVVLHPNYDTYVNNPLNLADGLETDDMSYRIIACGFEVVNTTAALTAQGNVIVYKKLMDSTPGVYRVGAGSSSPCTYITGVVQSANEAFATPGARSWAAIEGAYVPIGVRVDECEFEMPRLQSIFMITRHPGASTSNSLANINTSTQLPCAMVNTALGCSGAYFTGLSATTTLTVTAKFYVECVPIPNSALYSMTSNAALYNEQALSMYEGIFNQMPPGFMKSQNDAGDAWRIMKGLAATFRVVAPFIPVYGAPIAAAYDAVELGVKMHKQQQEKQLASRKKPVPPKKKKK